MKLFVTSSKRNLNKEDYQSIQKFMKTGDLNKSVVLKERKNENNKKTEKPKKMKKKNNNLENVLFRKFYERGDLPIVIKFTGPKQTLRWTKSPVDIDLFKYLPLFINGLTETEYPYDFISEIGSYELIAANPDKLIEVLPEIILSIKKALDSSNRTVIIKGIKIIQKLIETRPDVSVELIPYYKNLLPAFFKNQRKNCP